MATGQVTDSILSLKANGAGHDIICFLKQPIGRSNRHNHYAIKKVTFSVNNVAQLEIQLGSNLSRNPIIGTYFESLMPGDLVTACWTDSFGRQFQVSQTL